MRMAIPITLLLVLLIASLFSTLVDLPTGAPADDTPAGADGTPAGLDEVLPVVGSLANLKNLLAEAERVRGHLFAAFEEGGEAGEPVPAEAARAAEAPADSGADYSRTNVQVQGVDEADVVKTDGRYIYRILNQSVVIARAYPAAEMRVVRTLDFAGQGFNPFALYVDEKHLVVVGNNEVLQPEGPAPSSPKTQIYPPPVPVRNTVKVLVYDISDKERITRVREAEVEGHYVSSRKVGAALYLAVNKNVDYYIMRQEWFTPARSYTPSYRDTAARPDFITVDYSEIRYFPGSVEANYLIVAGLDLERPEQEMTVATYLGAGQNIYASPRNLYVAVTNHELDPGRPDAAAPFRPSRTKTALYRFALDRGKVTFTGKGEVPGTVLNQFSLDEHGDHFRVATTTGEIWRTDEHTSKNHVYVLDRDLHIVGRLEDIAPGERIYSARFLGDRAYLVTFRTVDPFFVLDLKDPEAPRILGALKIPGYSDYLHPYDENHVLGFGKETVEVTPGPARDGAAAMAYYQGMKIALFDVSDVANPIELFKETIGDRGTESELLHNHKALLFSREKNLLAFPVTVMEVRRERGAGADPLAYGEFAFQGAYVYRIDLEHGFRLKGRITHLPAAARERSGRGWYDSDWNVERILYIEDTLYTLSRRSVKAHDLDDLTQKNTLELVGGPIKPVDR